ncbi:MAG TPA: hypothetical protein VMF91_27695, partial [Bryobacteraceae bacterium]|nr:hypothetical protein [Bryobacteraceae bacterium]
NSRFAYVSISRASHEVHIYTNHAASLTESLSQDITKTSAITFSGGNDMAAQQGMEQGTVQPKVQDTHLGLAL